MTATSKPLNTLFPGRPDYTGPTTGVFSLLHHQELVETSHDVMERVAYVKRTKAQREVATRLHNIMYLGSCNAALLCAALDADYEVKLAPLDADYEAKRAPLDADYKAKRAQLDADYKAKRDLLYADYKAKHAPRDAD